MLPAAPERIQMNEFKYACPVCGQHIKCDVSQAGTVMECPTCFQKITVPQAPTTADQKFILTGSKVMEGKISKPEDAGGGGVSEKKFPVVKGLLLLAVVGIVVFALRGKISNLVSAWVWRAGDVGAVGAAGSFSRSHGVFTVNGSGADTWRRADGFYFVFQTLNGDGALTARVLNLKNTDLWAKAGVMIRENTNAGSMFAMSCIRPDGQVQSVWRKATDGEADSSALAGGPDYPKWVKIVRNGNSFSAYYKVKPEDGWLPIGAPQTISMASKVQIGLVVCAHNAGTLCLAQFDQVALLTGHKTGQH
jgi:DNA-directed RNA polymerase subunit RPC12/RpoP